MCGLDLRLLTLEQLRRSEHILLPPRHQITSSSEHQLTVNRRTAVIYVTAAHAVVGWACTGFLHLCVLCFAGPLNKPDLIYETQPCPQLSSPCSLVSFLFCQLRARASLVQLSHTHTHTPSSEGLSHHPHPHFNAVVVNDTQTGEQTPCISINARRASTVKS